MQKNEFKKKGDEVSSDGFSYKIEHLCSDWLTNIKLQNRENDLVPQATMLAQFTLNEIMTYGRINFSELGVLSRFFNINIECVLLRLPMIRITPIPNQSDLSTDITLELDQEVLINLNSSTLFKTPCMLKDAILNCMERSKQLYLTFSSSPANFDGLTLPNQEIERFFLNLSRDHTQNVEIRLVSLTQAVIFSNEGDIEKYRHEVIQVLYEYHHRVNPIESYFQSFTKRPKPNTLSRFEDIIHPMEGRFTNEQ